jgi:hypothetical protein
MSAELAHQKADKQFVWHSTGKCVLGYTLLWNMIAALKEEIYVEYCHIKRKGHSFS